MPDNLPAQPPPGQSAPGPHPHDMDPEELRVAAGTDQATPEGASVTLPDSASELPDDPHSAALGPHPHEAADHRRLGGDLRALPEGVDQFAPPETGTEQVSG